jgi:transposase
MARTSGVSISTVHRIWNAFSLAPHRSETFKLSTDPQFVEKVRDIVGLYLDPPERALVLCVDEKSQIQALDRAQPLLPMRPGQIERRTHDYERHGTTTLFAALDVKAGTIVGKCMPRHRAPEFRKFLDEIERNVPTDLDMHVVMDNASSHKTKLIRRWFAKRARWHVHFTPTSSSWINQVERFFALLSEQQIKRIDRSPNWRARSPPISKAEMLRPSRSAGLNPPMTSWHPSSASAAARSTPTQHVHRNFRIGTLG